MRAILLILIALACSISNSAQTEGDNGKHKLSVHCVSDTAYAFVTYGRLSRKWSRVFYCPEEYYCNEELTNPCITKSQLLTRASPTTTTARPKTSSTITASTALTTATTSSLSSSTSASTTAGTSTSTSTTASSTSRSTTAAASTSPSTTAAASTSPSTTSATSTSTTTTVATPTSSTNAPTSSQNTPTTTTPSLTSTTSTSVTTSATATATPTSATTAPTPTSSSTTAATSTTTGPIQVPACDALGFYSGPTCQEYYECISVWWWFEARLRSCITGYAFSISQQICVPEAQSGCVN